MKLYLAAATSTALLTACSTHNIQKNSEFVQAGLAQTEQVDLVLDETRRLVIDVDSNELVYLHNSHKKKGMLASKTAATLTLTKQIDGIKENNASTRRYFEAIEELINNPNRQHVETTVNSISSSLAQEHQRQKREPLIYTTSYDDDSYLKELSNLAVSAHYSAQIQNILRRDATIVGRHLDAQEAALKKVVPILINRLKTAQIFHLVTYVERPYLAEGRFMSAAWKADRLEWFDMQTAKPAIEDLIKTQQKLKQVWMDILRGNRSMKAFNHMLEDTGRVTNNLRNYRRAH